MLNHFTHHATRKRWGVTPAVLLCLMTLMRPGFAQDVMVIANPGHAQELGDRSFLKAAFTMRLRQWPDGTPIRVFVLPDADDVHAQFSRETLGTYPYVLRGIWDRLVYTGTGFTPTVVRSEQEMLEKIRTTPGALGYARSGPRSDASQIELTRKNF